jgi:hypothetical protein
MHENRDNRSRSNATGINNTNEDGGMQSYNEKTGYIEVRLVTGNSKVFNVVRAIKHFLAAAREQDDEFAIFPLAGIGNNLCIGADVPNSKSGIEQYFRHDVNFNNLNGKFRIHASQDIGQLKWGRLKFRLYLENQRVYINKSQLGDEDGITLGWTLKSHPAFCYIDDMKNSLYKIMGEEFKGI